jgi:hypothetical protein
MLVNGIPFAARPGGGRGRWDPIYVKQQELKVPGTDMAWLAIVCCGRRSSTAPLPCPPQNNDNDRRQRDPRMPFTHVHVFAISMHGSAGRATIALDVDFHDRGSFGPSPSLASRCCLHTRKSRRSAPLYCLVMAAQDPARSPVPARAIVGCCGHRAGVRRAGPLDCKSCDLWTASGPQSGRWQSICWRYVRKRCAPALRRLCATSSFFLDQDAEQRPPSIDWPARGHHVEQACGVDGGRSAIP